MLNLSAWLAIVLELWQNRLVYINSSLTVETYYFIKSDITLYDVMLPDGRNRV